MEAWGEMWENTPLGLNLTMDREDMLTISVAKQHCIEFVYWAVSGTKQEERSHGQWFRLVGHSGAMPRFECVPANRSIVRETFTGEFLAQSLYVEWYSLLDYIGGVLCCRNEQCVVSDGISPAHVKVSGSVCNGRGTVVERLAR